MRNMADGSINNVEDYVRELVRSALWNIGYHERGLRKLRKVRKSIEEMLQQSGFDLAKLDEIETNADELHEGYFDNVEHLAAALLASRDSTLEHHEEGLQNGHRELGLIKTLLARGDYDVDIATIQEEVDKRLNKP
jgi:hypothetical protein